ncbi:MAG: hypothetical protein HQK77_15345 [Desulfobacterales bacterium]|nr:hypothetical protein [Desulfobacterales bacterium]
MFIQSKESIKTKLTELKELFEEGILEQSDYEKEKKVLMAIWRQGSDNNNSNQLIKNQRNETQVVKNTQERAMHSQHIQLNTLTDRGQLIKDKTRQIQQTNIQHANQLESMEKEINEMSAIIGLDLKNADLSNVENLVELTDEEIKAIEKAIDIPPLEVIEFKDWASYSEAVDAFLKNEGVDPEKDPIFAMLSLTEIKDILQDYKDKYGEIFLNPKDYAIVFLAGITGALINQFAPKKLKNNKFFLTTHGKQIWDESLQEWKVFAKAQISELVGFNVDKLQEIKSRVIKEISSITNSMNSFKQIDVYVKQKITKKKKFHC